MGYDEDSRETIERMLDRLYGRDREVGVLRIHQAAAAMSLPPDIMEVFELLPAGDYTRLRLVDQLNSSFVARGMGAELASLT